MSQALQWGAQLMDVIATLRIIQGKGAMSDEDFLGLAIANPKAELKATIDNLRTIQGKETLAEEVLAQDSLIPNPKGELQRIIAKMQEIQGREFAK